MSGQYISVATVTRLHDIALEKHGGFAGIRDLGSLESAIARAQHVEAYNPSGDIFDIVAAVGFGIICDHPFVDGNKRTALLAMVEILRGNGKLQSPPCFTEKSTYQTILDVACGKRTADELASWLREIVSEAKI